MTIEPDADVVARYLQNHPEFFEQYAEVLSHLHFPNPHGDKAVSITERQVLGLRDKVRQLENKLSELIRFGEENDAIAEKVHHLALDLMAAQECSAVLRVIYTHLGGAFVVPHVALRLWIASALAGPEFATVSVTMHDQVAALAQPYCGSASGQEVVEWFGERGGHIRSLALIPLRRDGITVGALVLASEEAHRFYAEMGTFYLTRIADMSTAAILRTVV